MTLELSKEGLPSVAADGQRVGTTKQLKLLSDNMGLHQMNQTDQEIMEQLETLLLERIRDGDNLALFQLGQLYYEQVTENSPVHVILDEISPGPFLVNLSLCQPSNLSPFFCW